MSNALILSESPATPQLDYTRLRPKQRKFLRKIGEARFVIRKAAELAGVHEVTAYNWLADPRFRPYWDATIEAAVPIVEAQHIASGLERDTLSRLHFLKHRHPAYREKPLEIVQRTDANTVMASAANAIAATELAKAIGLLLTATTTKATELQVVEVEGTPVQSSQETVPIHTP